MNVLIEMTTLSFARPTAGASNEEFASWFEAKARLHQHIAAEGGPDADREFALAARAHQRSLSLRCAA